MKKGVILNESRENSPFKRSRRYRSSNFDLFGDPFGEHTLCWIVDLKKYIITVETSQKIACMPCYSKTRLHHKLPRSTSRRGTNRSSSRRQKKFYFESLSDSRLKILMLIHVLFWIVQLLLVAVPSEIAIFSRDTYTSNQSPSGLWNWEIFVSFLHSVHPNMSSLLFLHSVPPNISTLKNGEHFSFIQTAPPYPRSL